MIKLNASYLRQWNEVNIGRDYEIDRSVCVSVVPCLCVCVQDDWAETMAPFCENFYIGGDMHSYAPFIYYLKTL